MLFSYCRHEYKYDEDFIQKISAIKVFYRSSPHAFSVKNSTCYLVVWSNSFCWYNAENNPPYQSLSFDDVFHALPDEAKENLIFHIDLFVDEG